MGTHSTKTLEELFCLVQRRRGGMPLVLALLTLLTGVPCGVPPLCTAQTGVSAPVSFDVSPDVVTHVTTLLQTTGQSTLVDLPNYPLPDGRRATVLLQAFPLWDDNAEIAIPSGKEWVGSGRPRFRAQLLGHTKDGPPTTVQLRLTEQGPTGFVIHAGQLYRQSFVDNRVTFQALGSAGFDAAAGNLCGLDSPSGKSIVGTPPQPVGPPGESLADYLAALEPARPPRLTDALAAFCCVGAPSGQPLKFFDVAVETDDELMERFNFSSMAIQLHVTDLISAVNTLYWNANTGVLFRLRWFHIFQAGFEERSFDPFEEQAFMTQGNSFLRLDALRDLWLNNPDRIAKTRINRDIVLLISGTNLGGSSIFSPWECVVNGQSNGQLCSVQGQSCANGAGSCQWVGESLCRQDKAFAAVSFLDFLPNPFLEQVNSTAHELGHLFGAEHAHCTDTLTPPRVPPADPIDRCRSTAFSLRGEACWRGTAQAPPNNTDTVMSVCGAFFPNIQHSMTFHPRSAEVIHDAAQHGACGKPATVVLIQNGQSVQNLQSTSVAGRFYFALDVPTGQQQLEITTQGNGELILYERFGTLPTTWGTLVSNVPGTANQRITVSSPRAGRHYMLIFGWNPFSNVELRATFR